MSGPDFCLWIALPKPHRRVTPSPAYPSHGVTSGRWAAEDDEDGPVRRSPGRRTPWCRWWPQAIGALRRAGRRRGRRHDGTGAEPERGRIDPRHVCTGRQSWGRSEGLVADDDPIRRRRQALDEIVLADVWSERPHRSLDRSPRASDGLHPQNPEGRGGGSYRHHILGGDVHPCLMGERHRIQAIDPRAEPTCPRAGTVNTQTEPKARTSDIGAASPEADSRIRPDVGLTRSLPSRCPTGRPETERLAHVEARGARQHVHDVAQCELTDQCNSGRGVGSAANPGRVRRHPGGSEEPEHHKARSDDRKNATR